MKQSTAIISKQEALELLSDQLRKKNLPVDLLLKTFSLYSKISGWCEEEIPSTPSPEPSIDELVSQIEAKRKSQHV